MPFDTAFWTQLEGHSFDENCQADRYLGPTGRAVDGGALFEATHKGRPARLEVIPSGDGASPAASRWQQAAALSHPALAVIYAHGVTRFAGHNFAYLVTERGDEYLADVLAERLLSPAETREMLAPLLESLRYLHAQGYTHGALTPANIMASGDQLKLASGSIEAGGDPAADSRAIGVLLTDVLGHSDPARLPAPFNDIVRGCLQPDQPEERWSLARIEARLRDPDPAGPPRTPAADAGAPSRWRPSRWIAIAALAVGAMWLFGVVGSRPNASAPPAAAPAATPVPPPAAVPVQPPKPSPAPVVQDKPSPIPLASSSAGRNPTPPTPPTTERQVRREPPKPEPDQDPSPRAPQPGVALAPASLEGASRVMPDIPQHALNTITGRVRIGTLLRVDAAGNVTAARLDPPAASKYFSARVLAAARAWKFPASSSPRELIVNFELTREQVRVAGASERRSAAAR